MAGDVPDVRDMGGPGSRALFDRARAKVTALAPTAVEKYYPTQKTGDPDSLLTGTGRRMRHVKITDATQLDLPQLGALIEDARGHAESE